MLKKISKSEFESDLLDNTALNRKAVTNILEVWNYNDNSTYDLDELQNSYLVYCRYWNFAESKIKSIFEKLQAFFSLNEKEEEKKSKKRNDEEDEDETLKNKNIAALWCKDNEMKEGFNLIVDLFKGGGDPDQSINLEDFLAFINSPPWINKDHISLVSMKHEILSKKVVENLMKDFEDAVGEEILTAGQRSDNLVDPLKWYDFHESCNSNGIKVSIWEVFALFESINKTSIDEPDRYHECRVKNILEALDKDEIWQKYEDVELEKRRVLEAKKKKKSDANPRKSLENFNDREDDNELEDGDEEETKEAKKPNAKGKHDLDESGLFDRQDMNDDEDDFGQNMDEEDEIIEILKDDKGKKVVKPDTKPKGIIKSGNKEETKTNIKTPTKPQVKPGIKTPSKPLDKKTPSKPKVEETKQNRIDNEDDIEESAEFIVGKKLIDSEPNDVENSEANKCPKIKHIFEINVKEIRNIPILRKILKDLNRGDKQSELKQENKYIQDVYVKYIFPLDDEQIVSDFLEYSPRDDNSVDFKVSMHSYHSYLLETNKPVAESLRKCGGSFTINLSCLKENKDTNIGNIHMPIDDLIDLALNYEQAKGIDEHHKQSSSSRILFFYGTVFSQREEMLIGKLAVDFIYKREIVEVTSNRISGVSVSNDLYLQKEVYINRKIPLNGYLNIEIWDLNDLRNSLDNIEYLMSLYNHPDSRDNMQNRTSLSAKDDFSNKRVENIDRKRALLRIYKEGLNIGVVASVFDETPDLKDHFGTHQTKVIFKTLNPDFKDDHEYRIKMDTSIFEHFKYRSAVFEVRHYFVEESESLLDLGRKGDEISEVDSEFQTENRDYITLGYAKVPLVNLITKSNGVDQDVAVLDNFSQKLGYLRVKMSLNYQSKKKLKIMQNPKEKSVEGQYFLWLSFVELISQNNKYLDTKLFSDEIKHLIFKFKFEENTYQVRYVPDDNNTSHLPLSINVYKMNKMCITDFDINNESVERAAKPIEIQMWTKVENKRRCMKDVEELIGSVFIDLSALIGKRLNTRIRVEATEIFNSHDGYYTVFNNENDKIYADRLGMSIMLIKNEYKGHKEDLEKMFFTLHNETQKIILDEFDLNLKGHLDIDDLKKAIDHSFKNKNEIDLVYRYLYLLELKNPDSTYYSPLFNVLPPFFKYARRIDKEQIIEFMYKRLSSVNDPFKFNIEELFNNTFIKCLETTF